MRRPTFLRVYSSDATEKDDEATPLNRSDSDDVRNSFDNNELHLYTELHNDEQMLMFRPTMALEGPVARSYFDGTWPSGYKHASAVELGLGVGSFVSMGLDVIASGDVGRRRRRDPRRGLRPALVADPGAPAGRETGPHRGPGMSGVGGRPEASLQATRKISGAPRADK